MRKTLTCWPWITMIVAVLAAANPIGLDFFYSAFLSSEQLSRNIARPIYLMGVALLVLLIFIEWLIRTLIARWRRRAPGSFADAPAKTNTES